MIEWEDSEYKDAIDTILDTMGGADGGISFVLLRTFLCQCEEDGQDVPFVRQFARLCEHMSNFGKLTEDYDDDADSES
jgi:hypothetical protein